MHMSADSRRNDFVEIAETCWECFYRETFYWRLALSSDNNFLSDFIAIFAEFSHFSSKLKQHRSYRNEIILQ